MARLEYADATQGSDEYLALVEQIKRERSGRMLNLYRMLLNSPPVAAGWLHLGTAVRYQSKLSGRLRELAICQVGKLNRADYEYLHHEPLALREGVSAEQLAALDSWQESGLFNARERAVLAYTDAMTREVEVDDATFATVREHFDRQQLLELTATIGFYNMVTRLLVALRIDLD